MTLKQRDMNRRALEMGAAMVRDSDLEQLFGWAHIGDGIHNEKGMEKARAYAVRRIIGLIRKEQKK